MKTQIVLKLVIIFGLVLIGSISNADVYTQIGLINPRMKQAKKAELAHYITEACRDYSIPCDVFTAILAQESMFNIKAVNKASNDYGIGQINIKTIKAYKFDLKLLRTDLRYSIRASAKVLSWFKRYKTKEARWFCRYNVGTAKFTIRNIKSCTAYVAKVQQYQFETLVADIN